MEYDNEVLRSFFTKLKTKRKAVHLILNDETESVIYKGFKIEKELHPTNRTDIFTFTDLRFSNITNNVKMHEYNRMIEQGVIKTIDLISADFNKKLIIDLSKQLNSYEQMLETNTTIDPNYLKTKVEELRNEISMKEFHIAKTNNLYKNGK